MQKFLDFLEKIQPGLEAAGEYVSYSVFVLLAIMLVILIATRPKNMTSREVCMMATAISASFVLSYISVQLGANGGSITAMSYIPLILFCYAYGTPKGLLAALIYSVLQIFQKPYLLHPVQIALDYIIPFTAIGLAAALRPLLKNMKCYDVLISVPAIYLFRFICHVISGVFFWGTPLVGSMAYNAPYIVVDFILVFASLVALLKSNSFERLVKIMNPMSKSVPSVTENAAKTE